MKNLFSYLRWFQEKLRSFQIHQKYKTYIIISLCTMVGITIFFFAQSYCADDGRSVKVQAKATYEYSSRVKEEGSGDDLLDNEEQPLNDRIETIYVNNELLSGASALPTEPIVVLEDQK